MDTKLIKQWYKLHQHGWKKKDAMYTKMHTTLINMDAKGMQATLIKIDAT
jgi:hypothetical protein